ncbi:MAG: hypothetical protein AAGE89_09045 [Pseudomonadota bacterium]
MDDYPIFIRRPNPEREDDWSLFKDGALIGRVMRDLDKPTDHRWSWRDLGSAAEQSGVSDSFEAAFDAVKTRHL